MTLDVATLDQLDQDQVDQAFAYATQLLLEKQPNIDSKRGVLGDLVLGLDAILAGAQRTNTNRIRLSNSLAAIDEDPTLADDALVDKTISNYRLARRASQPAVGEVTIQLSQKIAVVIPVGTIFTANGQQFTADASYAARTESANVLDDTDRLIVQAAADRFEFTVSVTAVVAGSSGLLKKDTKLIPSTTPTSFVKAFAASDFTAGLDAQTNADLIALAEAGVAARAYSNRVTIPSTVRNASNDDYDSVTDAFPDILGLSIVGMQDAEMFRDQHWLFPVSGGGRTDNYLRSQQLTQSVPLRKTATLIDKTADGGIWQFSIGRDEAPGLYEVTKIVVAGAETDSGGYAVTEDIRAMDLTGDVYVPDITSAIEGVYSRYQAVTIRFLDVDTNTAALTVLDATQDYDVTAVTMPLVKAVQEFLGDRRVVNPAGDILVKACVPCFLSVSFELQRRRTEAPVDVGDIQTALAAYVNKQGFPGKLYAGALARIIDERLPANIDVGAIDMFGRIRRPDGAIEFIRSDDILTIPDLPEHYVTGRTVGFILDAASVAITEINVAVPAV